MAINKTLKICIFKFRFSLEFSFSFSEIIIYCNLILQSFLQLQSCLSQHQTIDQNRLTPQNFLPPKVTILCNKLERLSLAIILIWPNHCEDDWTLKIPLG